MLVWSIPIMTVLLVGGVAWVGSYDLDPRKAITSAVKPVRVQVVSLDWKWLFIYPEQGIATVNQLAIPVGTPVSLPSDVSTTQRLVLLSRTVPGTKLLSPRNSATNRLVGRS